MAFGSLSSDKLNLSVAYLKCKNPPRYPNHHSRYLSSISNTHPAYLLRRPRSRSACIKLGANGEEVAGVEISRAEIEGEDPNRVRANG